MSTRTFDGLMPLAPKSSRHTGLKSLAKTFAEPFESLGRAVEASHLVESGVDPRDAYDRVYKRTPLRDL